MIIFFLLLGIACRVRDVQIAGRGGSGGAISATLESAE